MDLTLSFAAVVYLLIEIVSFVFAITRAKLPISEVIVPCTSNKNIYTYGWVVCSVLFTLIYGGFVWW